MILIRNCEGIYHSLYFDDVGKELSMNLARSVVHYVYMDDFGKELSRNLAMSIRACISMILIGNCKGIWPCPS